MQDFLANYGLWILIALLAVAVLFFLFGGNKDEKAAPARPEAKAPAEAKAAADEPPAIEPVVLADPTGAMGIVPLAEPVLVTEHTRTAARDASAAKPKAAAKAKAAAPKPSKTAPAPKPAAKAKAEAAPKAVAAKAAPKAAAKPAAKAKAEPKAKVEAPAAPDDLLLIKGVGPKVNSILVAEGITRFAQIAAWKKADLEAIDEKLGTFAGRPSRDNWVDQAKLLAKGDTAAFEAKYGKL